MAEKQDSERNVGESGRDKKEARQDGRAKGLKAPDAGKGLDSPEAGKELDALEALAARAEAEALLAKYARFVDAGDAAGVASLFAEDGELRTADAPPIVGSRHIGKLYGRLLGAIRASSHIVGAQDVDMGRAAQGAVESHAPFHAWDSYVDDATPDCTSLGTYDAEIRREPDGRWRIHALTIGFVKQD